MHNRYSEPTPTGWRLWLSKRPRLFGFSFATVYFTLAGIEVIKKLLPIVTLLLIVGAIGYFFGASS